MTGSPLAALEFLTRLRVRRTPIGEMSTVARAQAWFPAIGLLIGLALVAVDRLAMRALPETSIDVLIVIALVAVTGALHLDGLGDAADGLLGGYTPARRLEIMRDAHAGTYAVVAIVSVLALKFAGLAALPAGVRIEALLLAPCLARWALLVATVAFPYARVEGAGAGFRDAAWPWPIAGGTAIAGAATIALLGPGGLYVAVFAAGVALGVGAFATRLAGGMTGDTYGATIEIGEAALLLFVAAMANRGWLHAWVLS